MVCYTARGQETVAIIIIIIYMNNKVFSLLWKIQRSTTWAVLKGFDSAELVSTYYVPLLTCLKSLLPRSLAVPQSSMYL